MDPVHHGIAYNRKYFRLPMDMMWFIFLDVQILLWCQPFLQVRRSWTFQWQWLQAELVAEEGKLPEEVEQEKLSEEMQFPWSSEALIL